MPEATLTWQGDLAFEVEVGGHRMFIDHSAEGPGKGPPPMALWLVSLAGCTGMDVVYILRRKRIQVDAFEVHVAGKRKEGKHPRIYETVDIRFTVRGPEVPEKAVLQAMRLSRDTYCSVSAMTTGPVIRHFYRIEDPEGNVVAEGELE